MAAGSSDAVVGRADKWEAKPMGEVTDRSGESVTSLSRWGIAWVSVHGWAEAKAAGRDGYAAYRRCAIGQKLD